jgi:SAM-dependent methyltransferase
MSSRPRGDRKNLPSERYDAEFFDWLDAAAVRSARIVAPIILDLLPISSVVDVGCGRGAWLSVFQELGVERILGIDGDYVDRDRLAIPIADFLAHDLTKPLVLDRGFDLAVSLEVAEHLEARFAASFVRTLTSLADVVMFSAAIPFQGGTNHVNEQWPDYWAELFAREEYQVVDVVRPRVWDEPDVEVWYAQNTLLFIAKRVMDANADLRALAERPQCPLSIVHPRLFLGPRRHSPRQLVSILKASIIGPAKQGLIGSARRLRQWKRKVGRR